MAKRNKYKAKNKDRQDRADPRLVALVKLLARHAAERDYERLQIISAARTEGPAKSGQARDGSDS